MRKVNVIDLDNTFTYISKPNEWFKEGSGVQLEANCGDIGGLFRGIILINETHGPYYATPDKIGTEVEDGDLCSWDEFDIYKDGEKIRIIYEDTKRICPICTQLIDVNKFTEPDKDGSSWCIGCDNDAKYDY